MVTYQKRNNLIVGIIMNFLMLMYCIISFFNNISGIAYNYDFNNIADMTHSAVNLAADGFILMAVIAAFVFIIIKRRQGGISVALSLIARFIWIIAFFIGCIIEKSTASWTSYLDLLLVIPIALIIFYFYFPNIILKVSSAVVVGITFLITLVLDINFLVQMHSYWSFSWSLISYYLSMILSYALYALIIVQIFRSFKKVRTPAAVNTYNQPLASQPAVPVVQSAAPVQNSGVSKETVITNYGNLLKKGLITQEQYDEKLKELFG